MKETSKKIGELNLKSQLSRNQQKKIVGGLTVQCPNGFSFTFGICPYGYCEGTRRGGPTVCY